ncbi:MAG: hypothetical protein JWO38_2350 [Gemmataceae bacterium]|nr:hypothetical protein [Gemmataceae bacterium]
MAKQPANPLVLSPAILQALENVADALKANTRQTGYATASAINAAARGAPENLSPAILQAMASAAQQVAARLPAGSTQQQQAADRAAREAATTYRREETARGVIQRNSRGESPAEAQALATAINHAVARAPGGVAEVRRAAEKAAVEWDLARGRRMEVEAVVERRAAGVHGTAREAIEAAAQRAGAGVVSGDAREIAKVADEAAKKTARAYTSGLVASNEKLFRQAGLFSDFGLHGVGSSMARIGGISSHLHELGMTGAGAALSKLALPLAAAKAGADVTLGTIKTTAGVMHDEYLTQGQRERALFKGIVPGGETALDWIDTVSGRKRDMERTGEQYGRMQIGANTAIGVSQLQFGLQQQGDRYRIHAETLGGATAVQMPVIDRSSVQGEREYRLQSRLLSVRDRMQKTDIAAAEAAKAVTAATAQRTKAEAEGLGLQKEEAEIRAKLKDNTAASAADVLKRAKAEREETSRRKMEMAGHAFTAPWLAAGLFVRNEISPAGAVNGPEGAERLSLLNRLAVNKDKQIANDALQTEATKAEGGRKIEAAQAVAEAAKAKAEQNRAQAEYDEHRAGHAAGHARNLARMGAGARLEGKMAYDLVTANPHLLTLDPYLAAKAESYAPDVIGKRLEVAGEKLGEFKHAKKIGEVDLRPGETIEGVRQEGIKGRNRESVAVLKADQERAVIVDREFGELFERLVKIAAASGHKALDKYELGLRQGKSP